MAEQDCDQSSLSAESLGTAPRRETGTAARETIGPHGVHGASAGSPCAPMISSIFSTLTSESAWPRNGGKPSNSPNFARPSSCKTILLRSSFSLTCLSRSRTSRQLVTYSILVPNCSRAVMSEDGSSPESKAGSRIRWTYPSTSDESTRDGEARLGGASHSDRFAANPSSERH